MTKKNEHGEGAWWEKLTEASADASKGKGLVVKALIVGIVVMAGILIWQFVDRSSKGNQDELAMALFEAGSLIPDFEEVNFGRIPDLQEGRNSRYPVTLASTFYRRHQPDSAGRNNPLGATMDAEGAAAYVGAAERAITQLGDIRDKFDAPEWELKYLHTLQQLHFYAGLNSAEVEGRKKHLDRQLELLKELESKYAGEGLLGIKPFKDKPIDVLGLWRQSNEEALRGCEILARTGKLEILPDSNLSATIELENGQVLKMRFFSEASPKAVQNFLDHARKGLYDGIAVHRVDAAAGVLELGSTFSRLAPDRKFLWGREAPGYTVPPEGTTLLPVKRGSVTTKPMGLAGHGLFFEIHVAEPDRANVAQAVIGEITEGLEALDSWIQTGVHDEVGVADRLLPRTRLGVKSVKVEGEPDNKGDDSWVPVLKEETIPEVNAIERQFEEALKAANPDEGDTEPEENGAAKPDENDEDN